MSDALDLLIYLDEALTKNLNSLVIDGYIEKRTSRFIEDRTLNAKTGNEGTNQKYGEDRIIVDIKDSYYNMKKMIEPHMEIIELAKKSMEEIGVEPLISPIRGGTDGASLSYKGLPCPNIFTGGYNYHGRYELLPVESLRKGKELLLQIIKNLENFDFKK